MINFKEDRSQFPEKNPDGTFKIDLASHKFSHIWQGPQHPGITGNMSLELIIQGDEVMSCKTHVGYLHRGFEKLMERRKYIQCFPLVCRICVPEPDFNEHCFATAVEELAGITVPEKALWLRTLVLEMARTASYLMWFGGAAGSLGMGIIGQWTNYLRDYILDRFEELTGGRIYHMYILPGGVRNDLPVGFKERLLDNLKDIEQVMKDVDNALFTNAVFKKRTVGLGYIDPSWIEPFGITGPNARAAGVPLDVRKDAPYLKYDELDFEPVTGKESDAFTRADVRRRDLLMSVDLIRQILDKIPQDGEFIAELPNVLNWEIPKGETYVKSECTRGEYGYYMVSDGSMYPRRINVRGPSYTHAVALMEKLAIGVNIADTAALMVSLHTYPPEIER
ncbi:MAG TPA: NADH-quinone oxidoreductase subunit D [bacterium]|nr:NADH-quinone oxidoreductase subunit D [bacterium]HOG42704.1 NADH-quinone oxidoreductase subunit D [bacterium]